MILRLSVVTTLMAVFAMGLSTLVEMNGRGDGHRIAGGCFDRGAVCAPILRD